MPTIKNLDPSATVTAKRAGVVEATIVPGASATMAPPAADAKISLSAGAGDVSVDIKNDDAVSYEVKASNAGTGVTMNPGDDQNFTVPGGARLNINHV